MQVRLLPILLALLVLALWPQSLVLCISACGHVELEVAGAPCCPEEEGDCEDCADFTSPDVRPALVTLDLLPDRSPERPADRSPAGSDSAPPAPIVDIGDGPDGIVLLI